MESKLKTHPRRAQEPRLCALAASRDCPLPGSVLIIRSLHNAIKHPRRRSLGEESADLAPCSAVGDLSVMGSGGV